MLYLSKQGFQLCIRHAGRKFTIHIPHARLLVVLVMGVDAVEG